MRLLGRMLPALIMAAAFAPAFAVTLEPGAYKLEWKVPQAGSMVIPPGPPALMMKINADEAAKINGLISKKAMSGRSGEFLIVLDESKGAGKGYDTAYVLASAPDAQKVELKYGLKIPLVKRAGILCSDEGQSYTIDLALGEGESQVAQKAAVDLAIQTDPTVKPGKEEVAIAMLSLRGGWYGKIKTDAGDLSVFLIDTNGNCIFGDRAAVGRDNPAPTPGDAIVLGASLGGFPFGDPGKTAYFGKAVSYGGKLYVFESSSSGDTLEIRPYTAAGGTLRIEAKDGYGKPTGCPSVMLTGESSMYELDTSEDWALPAGRYKCEAAILMPEQTGPPGKWFGMQISVEDPIKVTGDAQSVLRLGGRIYMEIDAESNTIAVRRGDQLDVILNFTVGTGTIVGIQGGREPTVNIRDAKSKIIKTGKATFG